MEEILEFAGMEIKRSGYSRHLHAGVVLTGGGSLIKGTKELASKVLGMPVKIGVREASVPDSSARSKIPSTPPAWDWSCTN